jgi:uncharacterized protein YukE
MLHRNGNARLSPEMMSRFSPNCASLPPVGLVDDLRAAIGAAEGAIAGLGPRPSGDPGALEALARRVRSEADRAATAGRLERNVVPALDFEGPAAERFDVNAREVSESLFVAQRMLDDAADAIAREARRIETAQHEHDRAHRRLVAQLQDLGREIARAGR